MHEMSGGAVIIFRHSSIVADAAETVTSRGDGGEYSLATLTPLF